MKEKLLHTPEGVRDIYNSECKRKSAVEKRIHHILELYGYQDIETPTFEFFDIFNSDTGTVSSVEMFKFFDRNNNTLVLRPDMTPSIARSVAKYYSACEFPLRLSYRGNTFLNNRSYQGKLTEKTEMGAELIKILFDSRDEINKHDYTLKHHVLCETEEYISWIGTDYKVSAVHKGAELEIGRASCRERV